MPDGVASWNRGRRREADFASGAAWPFSIHWRLTLPANDRHFSYRAFGTAKELAFIVDRRPTLPAECAVLMPHSLELLPHQR